MNQSVTDSQIRPIFTELLGRMRQLIGIGNEESLGSEPLGVLLPYLLLDLHQQAAKEKLHGHDSSDRFRSFEKYCATQEYADRLVSLRPDLIDRIHKAFVRRQRFESWVNHCIAKDKDILSSKGLFDDGQTPKFDIRSVSGDWHDDKPTVKVQCGKRNLYLKNRTSDNALLVHDVWEIIFEHANKGSLLDLHWAKCLSVDDHSWDEAVPRQPLDSMSQADDYYRRLGQLLFTAYALRLSDLHYENIIPCGAYPVIIDYEALGSDSIRRPCDVSQAYRDIIAKQRCSVILTGMLPTGGFTDKLDRLSPLYEVHFQDRSREIVDFAKDTMRFRRAGGIRIESDHLPYIVTGSERSIDVTGHEQAFIGGFSAAYEAFLASKDDVIRCVERSHGCTARILLRNTKEYGATLMMLGSERWHGRSEQLLVRFSSAGQGIDRRILCSEKQTLVEGYIPAFFCGFDHTEIHDESGRAVGCLETRPTKALVQHLKDITTTQQDEQIRLIDFSLSGVRQMTAKRWGAYVGTDTKESIDLRKLRTAESRLSEIIQQAEYKAQDGSVEWSSLSVDDMDSLILGPMGDGIYKGVDGVLLALGEKRLKKPCSSATQYGSAYMGGFSSMLADSAMCATDLLPIMEQVAVKDESHDVLSGNAGLILASRNQHGARWKRFVSIAADHLVRSAVERKNTISWLVNGHKRMENASFAHGNAGIGTALMFAYCLTGDANYLPMSLSVMESDRQFALPGGLWRDARKQSNEPTANWCHGITGMAISRILWIEQDYASGHELLDGHLRANMIGELRTSLSYLLSSMHDLESFSLCHGVAGSLQVLIYALEQGWLDDVQRGVLCEDINEFIHFGLSADWRCGTQNYYCYSLMTGLAGILLLLRQIEGGGMSLEPLIPLCRVRD